MSMPRSPFPPSPLSPNPPPNLPPPRHLHSQQPRRQRQLSTAMDTTTPSSAPVCPPRPASATISRPTYDSMDGTPSTTQRAPLSHNPMSHQHQHRPRPTPSKPSTPPRPTWIITAPSRTLATPCLRAGHSLASYSNRLYLFGGYCDYASYVASSPPNVDQLLHGARPGIGIHFNSLHEYRLDTCQWHILHPGCHPHEARGQALPKPRRHASMVVHGGSLFVYGGFDVDDNVLPDFWEFRVDTATWNHIPLSSPAGTSPSSIHFPDGFNSNNNNNNSNNSNNSNGQYFSQSNLHNNHHHGGHHHNNHGHNNSGNLNHGHQQHHDPLGVMRRGGTNIPVARAEHTAVVDGNRMIVFGGYDGKKKLNDTYVFDFATRQWFRPPAAECNAPSRRCKHSAVLYKRKMYVVGGFQFNDGDNYALTDMHVLDLDTFSWSCLLMGNSSPEALQGHKAVVCGDSMYIVGGKVRVRSRQQQQQMQHQQMQHQQIQHQQMQHQQVQQQQMQQHQHQQPVSLNGISFPSNNGVDGNGNYMGMNGLPPSTMGSMSDAATGTNTGGGQLSLPNTPNLSGQPSNGQTMNETNNQIPASASVINMDNRGSGLNGTVFRYTFESNRWSAVETTGPVPIPRQLHAAVALSSDGGGGRMSIFLFGGTDRSKQRFFYDLCELRGIRSGTDTDGTRQACETCSGTKSLLDNSMFSDVTFIVENRRIYAHRCILYARAEYFRNMFDSNMRESNEKEILIPDVTYDVFKAVLEYLYSGSIDDDDDDDMNDDYDDYDDECGEDGLKSSRGSRRRRGICTTSKVSVELLKVADMFRIEGLRNLCVEKVEQAVNIDNAAFICQVADLHHANTLKQFCINFIMHNFRDVIRSETFHDLMRQDPGGLGREILDAYSDNNGPNSGSGAKRPRK